MGPRMDKRQARSILEAQRALVDSLAQALAAVEALVEASRRVVEEVNTATAALDEQGKLESERKRFAAMLSAVKQVHETMKSVLPKIR